MRTASARRNTCLNARNDEFTAGLEVRSPHSVLHSLPPRFSSAGPRVLSFMFRPRSLRRLEVSHPCAVRS